MFFTKDKEPVIFKEHGSGEKQLEELQLLCDKAKGKLKEEIEQEIRNVKAGMAGEENVIFELKNSHIPMYVLRDIYIEYEDYTAQIDFVVVTAKLIFIIECKNMYGNIEVDNKGAFTRVVEVGGRKRREGIYSPITQNERHLALLRKMNSDKQAQKGMFSKIISSLIGGSFDDNYRAITVIANPKSVVNDRFAPKEIKNKLIRADALIEYIKRENAKSNAIEWDDKSMKSFAEMFLSKHSENTADYTERFRKQLETCCPECGGELVLRSGKYGEFFGCSNYPECRFTKKKA